MTPFGLLFKALDEDRVHIVRNRDKTMDAILGRYNKKNDGFRIGNGFYMPTRMDVKLVLGIEDGNSAFGNIIDHGRNGSEFGPRLFGNLAVVKAKDVMVKVKELVKLDNLESKEDTVKLMCLVLMHSLLIPSTCGNIAWGYFHYVDSIANMREFDWSSKIHMDLLEGLRSKWKQPSKVKGCTILLMFWLCERSEKLDETLSSNSRDIQTSENALRQWPGCSGMPRLSKWRRTEVEDIIAKAHLDMNEKMHFSIAELHPTAQEMVRIQGLALEVDAMEQVANDVNTVVTEAETSRKAKNVNDYNNTIESANIKGKEICIELQSNEHMDFGTPSFSLCATHEMPKTVKEKNMNEMDGSMAECTNLMRETEFHTPTTTRFQGREEQPVTWINSTGSSIYKHGFMMYQNNAAPEKNEMDGRKAGCLKLMPETKFHTPTTTRFQGSEEQPVIWIKSTGSSKYKHGFMPYHQTSEPNKHLANNCGKKIVGKALEDEFKKVQTTMVELKREKALLTYNFKALERENKGTQEALESAIAQITDLIEELHKVRGANTELLQTLAVEQNKVKELQERVQGLEEERRKCGMNDMHVTKDEASKTAIVVSVEDQVIELQKEKQVERSEFEKMHAEIQKQAALIQLLMH